MITMMKKQLIFGIINNNNKYNNYYYYGNKFPRPTGQPNYITVKVTLEQATKAQRGSRGMALLFL